MHTDTNGMKVNWMNVDGMMAMEWMLLEYTV